MRKNDQGPSRQCCRRFAGVNALPFLVRVEGVDHKLTTLPSQVALHEAGRSDIP